MAFDRTLSSPILRTLAAPRLVAGVCLVALVAAGAPSIAEAQAWLQDRQRTEGPGIRLGDFELHPGIGLELGYDSNLYYTQDNPGAAATPRDSGILRAAAHLNVATRGQERQTEGEAGGGEENQGGNDSAPIATFRGGVSGSFYHFFNDTDRTNMEINAGLNLGVLPGRAFSFDITDQFGRAVRPFSEVTTAVSYGRIQNDAGLNLNFATTGEILKVRLSYNFQLDFFENINFQYGNSLSHVITLAETFRFLPSTAIVHDTTLTFGDYMTPLAGLAASNVADSVRLRTRVGLNGAFTNEFSILAMVGYAAGWFDSRDPATYDMEYESLVAQIEARWQIDRSARLSFGYDRDFNASFVGNYYRRDRGYANFQILVDRVFLVGLNAEVGYFEFGSIVQPDLTTPVGNSLFRSDIRVIASLFLEYRLTDWFGINGTVRYTGDFTDYQYNRMMGMGVVPDAAGYNKVELWLGVRAFY